MHTSIRNFSLLALASLWGCARGPADAPAAAASQGESWQAINQLPDWSGVWALHEGWVASADAYLTDLHLTPAYEKIRADARAERRQANLSTCLPAGASAVLQHATLFEILFTPKRVTMLFEDGEIRRIDTSGRAHRPLSDFGTSFMGDSIGHWEGATLVVDTIGFPNGELWQNYGVRATINTHLVERITLNQDGELVFINTMTDAAIFQQPYVFERRYRRSPLTLEEPVCVNNNRDTGDDLDLTPPPED